MSRIGALLTALALLGAACSSKSAGGQGNSGGSTNASITIALGSEPTTLDPQLRDDGNERAVTVNIYETLLTRNAQGDLAAARDRPADAGRRHDVGVQASFRGEVHRR